MQVAARIVLCTVPDRDAAETIATSLVKEQLAACVNIVPGITSIYRWKNNIEKDPELLLIIKTTDAAYPSLQERICMLHPYELPEVVAVTIDNGLNDYLEWIKISTK